MATPNKTTYEELINNDDFVGDAGLALRALGEKVVFKDNSREERKAIVDNFLKEKRWFESNLGSTYAKKTAVDSMSEADKESFGKALNASENLPTIFEEGGAPTARGLYDYAVSSITDPTNFLSLALGAVSFGAGTAATQTAKQAVKSQFANKLKAGLGVNVSTKAALTLSAPGAIGGAARTALQQQTEIETGTGRQEVDTSDLVTAALIEGPGAFLAGGVISKTLSQAAKQVDVLASKTPTTRGGAEWLKNNFLPKGYRDESALRSVENLEGLRKVAEAEADVVAKSLDDAIENSTKGFSSEKRQEVIDEVNNFLVASKDAKPASNLNQNVVDSVNQAKNIISEAQGFAQGTDGLSSVFREVFTGDYARTMYEVFNVNKRSIKFDDFIKQQKTKGNNILDDLDYFLQGDDAKNWFDNLLPANKKLTATTNLTYDQVKNSKDLQLKLAKNLYSPKNDGFKNIANVESRVNLPKFQQDLYGKNLSPSMRLKSSVSGIYGNVLKHRLAKEFLDILPKGSVVKGSNAIEAAENLGVRQQDVVRFIGQGDNAFIPAKKGRLDSTVADRWITKEQANRLDPFTKRIRGVDQDILGITNPVASGLLSGIARTQGTLKLNKTVLSPIAHLRNGLGATQAILASGNTIGTLPELVKTFAAVGGKQARQARQELKDLAKDAKALGVTNTSVELEQILTRLGRDMSEDPALIEKIFSLGISGTKAGKLATKVYGKTDDIGKILTFAAERRFQQNLFKNLNKTQIKDYLAESGFESQEQAIRELAARNTLNVMPVYSRVPAFTEALRGIPVIGNFTAYPLEVFRNSFKILQLGAKEIDQGFRIGSNELITRGSTRIASISTVAAAPYAVAAYINAENKDEQLVESLRDFVMPWHQNGAIVVDKIDKEAGTVEYRDFAYSNPLQPLTKVLATVSKGLSEQQPSAELLTDVGKTALGELLGPYTDKSLANTAINGAWDFVSSDDERVRARGLKNVVKSLNPGVVQQALDATQELGGLKSSKKLLGLASPQDVEQVMYPKFAGELREPPKDLSELDSILSKKGYNLGALTTYKINLTTSAKFAMQEINSQSNKQWSNFTQETRNLFQDPTMEIPAQEILNKYKDTLEVQYYAQQGVANLFNDLKNILGETKAKKVVMSYNLDGVISKRLKRKLLSDNPQSDLKTLSYSSAASSFWKKVRKTQGGRDVNMGAWRQAFKEIDDKYNRKSVLLDIPVNEE